LSKSVPRVLVTTYSKYGRVVKNSGKVNANYISVSNSGIADSKRYYPRLISDEFE